MSILTAIFQAIGQAITFIFPMSESGHASIFNDFSARFSGVPSELTGLIHIGIAVGILIVFYKLFIKLTYEFFSGFGDLFHKKLEIKNANTRRKFMFFTLIPFFFMPLYLIPVGEKGNIYQALNSLSYDGNLISEGVCFIIIASLLLFASLVVKKGEKNKSFTLPLAIILGVLVFFTIPISGLSLCAVVVSIIILAGVNKKVSVRYFVAISAPILLVQGIIEIATCGVYDLSVIAGIIGVIVAIAASYLACKFLLFIVNNYMLKYVSYYDYAIGVIILIVGIVEVLIK